MDWNATKEQLIREAKAKPGKTAALGGLLVVAIWFWAPLVAGWLPKGQAAPVAPPAIASATTPTAVITPSQMANATAVPSEPSWRDVADWIDEDGLMLAAAAPELFPFGKKEELPPENAAAEEENKKEVKKAIGALTPQELGVRLTSTIVGPRRKLAMIGGRPYLEGRQVTVKSDEMSYSFMIAEIRPQTVVLLRDGQRHVVKIQKENESVIYE